MNENKGLFDTVSIAVPPKERMCKVVRLATTAIANRTGLNIDQADDLNTAVDELFRLFVSQSGEKKDFCVHYVIKSDRLEIQAEGCAVLADSDDKIGRYSRFLLENLSDSIEERPNPEGGVDVVLVKNLTRC